MGQILLVILIPVMLFLLARAWASMLMEIRSNRRRIPRFITTRFEPVQSRWTVTRRFYSNRDHKRWDELFDELQRKDIESG